MTLSSLPSDAQIVVRDSRAEGTSIVKGWSDFDWTTANTAGSSGSLSVTAVSNQSQTLHPLDCYALSIATQRAINAIQRNCTQAKWRLFTRTGREITRCPLMTLLAEPYPYMPLRQWVAEFVGWRLLKGDRAAQMQLGADGKPRRLKLLNPYLLTVAKPLVPESRADVAEWRYTPIGADAKTIKNNEIVFDRFWNPSNIENVRGLGKLIAGGTQAGISVYASLYTNSFFYNDASPSRIVALPSGTPKKEVDLFMGEFRERHQSSFTKHNWHKTIGVRADEITIHPLDQEFQDGSFMEVQKWADEKMGQLFGVPPIEMHNLQKTRFDTANEERKMFAESTIMPELDELQHTIQTQLINQYFAYDTFTTQKGFDGFTGRTVKNFDKALRTRFEKAIGDAPDSDIMLLIDPDTMPIMGDVKMAQTQSALAFRTTYYATPKETADFAGVELPDNPIRDDVYGPATDVNLTHPENNIQILATRLANEAKADESDKQREADAAAGNKDEAKPPKKELTAEDRIVIKSAEKFVRALRKLTLERMFPSEGKGELWGLHDAETLKEYAKEHRQMIRRVRFDVMQMRKAHEGEALKAVLKDYFNAIDTKRLLGL